MLERSARPLRVTAMLGPLLALALAPSAVSTRIDRGTPLPLRRVADARLPGRPTRFDYQSVDPAARRLYIAHLGDSAVVAVDLDSLQVVTTVRDVADAHGVLVIPELGRVVATAAGTNELVTIDATTNSIVGRTPTGTLPDGIAYDADHALVLVSNLRAGSATIVDAGSGTPLRTVELGAEAGNVNYDPATHLAWIAVSRPDRLVAFDPVTGDVNARIRLDGCDGAHGVYLEPARRVAYVACENNARLAVVDMTRRRVTSRLRVGSGPDVLAFDSADGRLYIAAESGIVTVVATNPEPRKLARGHLADHAHTVAVDQTTRRVFFPLQNHRGRPALRVMAPSPG